MSGTVGRSPETKRQCLQARAPGPAGPVPACTPARRKGPLRLLAPVLPFLGLLAGLTLAPLQEGRAQQAAPSQIGTFQDWSAYEYREGGEKVCFILSRPTRKGGAERSRGDAYVMVTFRTADRVRDEVSVNFGATLREKSQAQMRIGGTTVPLVTDRDTAWTTNPGQDRVAVEAMIRGADMRITGVSSAGTAMEDTYSLMGVTAARQAISRACG